MTFRPKPLSLSLFTILFVVLFLILLFTLGNLTYREFEHLDNKFRIANEHSAAVEIESALSEAISLSKEKPASSRLGRKLGNSSTTQPFTVIGTNTGQKTSNMYRPTRSMLQSMTSMAMYSLPWTPQYCPRR